MVCIYCSADTRVINSRLQKRANNVWRRRTCMLCYATFTTYEVVQYADSWRVLYNSALVAFSRDKLLVSIYSSLRHRPDGLKDAGALTETTITNLRAHSSSGLLTAEHIRNAVLGVLNNFDHTAAVHYAAFHK